MPESQEKNTQPFKEISTPDSILDVQQTTCCIVGGGPAGTVLALILARQGIAVTLLEAHKTFDRDFRGEGLQAGAMEIMDELGLTERLLMQSPHSTLKKLIFTSGNQTLTFADFSRLKTPHPHLTLIPQKNLLEFLTAEAKCYPNFQFLAGAFVRQLVEEEGITRGVRYWGERGWHEVRADLIVGTDGRFSQIRKLAGMELIETAAPMDLLWFRLLRYPDEPEELRVRYGRKRVLIAHNTFDGNWQIAAVIPKGSYRQIQVDGIEAFRESIVEVVSAFSDRVHHLKDWKQTSLLSVQMGRLSQWYRPGLLLLGDAAHVLSPLGGVGITYAIQDAVAAANVLSEPLKRKEVKLSHLARVQRDRELAIKVIQGFQSFTQKYITAKVLQTDRSFTLPSYLGLPLLSDLRARLLAFGVFPPHIKTKFSL